MKATTLLGLLVLFSLVSCMPQNGKPYISPHPVINDTPSTNNPQPIIEDTEAPKRKPQYENFKFEYPDFEVFYNKFISDSAFQINRVKFPLKGRITDYEGDTKWEKKTWPMMNWNLRDALNTTEDSLSIKQSNDRFFFGAYCRECGFSFEMAFEKINEGWYLTYRQENNF